MSPIQDILRWNWLQNTEMKTQVEVLESCALKNNSDQNGGVEFEVLLIKVDL